MKTTIKSFIIAILCLMAFSVNAQRCAVLDFNAGSSIISQADLAGSYAIFITYFRPTGYTMVERTQIDKVIREQGFQRSQMTQAQMVRVGKILNVSKIVVGDINFVSGKYQVYARVINVETGTIAATEGATFATSSFRSSMQSVAQKLASKIAITETVIGSVSLSVNAGEMYDLYESSADSFLEYLAGWKYLGAKDKRIRYTDEQLYDKLKDKALREYGSFYPDLDLKDFKWNVDEEDAPDEVSYSQVVGSSAKYKMKNRVVRIYKCSATVVVNQK